MISKLQQEAIAVLTEVWELAPEVRLGQLFAHLGFLGEVHLGRGLGYIDDDEMLSVLCRHRAELKARVEGISNQPLRTDNDATLATAGSNLPESVSTGEP